MFDYEGSVDLILEGIHEYEMGQRGIRKGFLDVDEYYRRRSLTSEASRISYNEKQIKDYKDGKIDNFALCGYWSFRPFALHPFDMNGRRYDCIYAGFMSHAVCETASENVFEKYSGYKLRDFLKRHPEYIKDGWNKEAMEKAIAKTIYAFFNEDDNFPILVELLNTQHIEKIVYKTPNDKILGTVGGKGLNLLGKALTMFRDMSIENDKSLSAYLDKEGYYHTFVDDMESFSRFNEYDVFKSEYEKMIKDYSDGNAEL